MKSTLPQVLPVSSPYDGPGLSRRGFLELGAGGLVASWFLRPHAAWAESASLAVTPKASARNVIFVFLPGAPSQVDMWDLKEGAWTPADFAPTSTGGGLRWPAGLLPKLGGQLSDFSLVRSVRSSALVHGLGQTWIQIARNPTGATGSIAPHLGAVAALELAASKATGAVLPAFVALNAGGISGSGYFPSAYSPFAVQPTATGLASLTHPDGSARFALRWSDLQSLDAALRSGQPIGKDASDAAGFYDQAKVLMDSPDVNALFSYSTSDSARYGSTTFGNSCLVARQILGGNRGARFVQVTLGNWDMHSGIYTKGANNSLYGLCPQLDNGLSALLADLKAAPGSTPGKSLFDETLVVAAGEFGRTVGTLNGQAGRDHFANNTVFFAGGGVKGGQVIGATDATGATVTDSGVSGRADLRTEDVACTIYSALGIDWTIQRHDDPLGRGFEYVPFAKDGVYAPIDRLFG